MPRKHRHLFEKVITLENLFAAADNASRGRSGKAPVARGFAELEKTVVTPFLGRRLLLWALLLIGGGDAAWHGGMLFQIEYRRYRLAFRAPVRTAHGVWAEREGLLVRLTGEAGRMGWGEVAPIPWFGTESVDEAEACLRDLGGRVSGEMLAAVPERLGCLRFALRCAERGMQASPDEGRRRLLEASPALPVAALLPAGRAALARIGPRAELGFRTFKWKVGAGDAADELALLDDVVAALPSGARLRLDANGAWDRRTAERWLDRVAGYPVEFVEQPVAVRGGGLAGERERRRAEDLLLGLAGDFPTRLALDESLVGASDVEHWLGLGWPGLWVVKPALIGDAGGVIDRLAAGGVARGDVVFSSALETAVGARAALELAFVSAAQLPEGAVPRALGFGVWPLFTADARACDGLGEMPFVRARDLPRLDAGAAWACCGGKAARGGQSNGE